MDLRDIVDNAIIVEVGSNMRVGIFNEKSLTVEYAGDPNDYKGWIKKINIGETETIKLSAQQGYATKAIPMQSKDKINVYIARMEYIKRIRDGLVENKLLDGEF
jgi:hypothetical protein